MPHHLFIHNRGLCATTVALSLLISLWALWMDPVINVDGIIYVEAAEFFMDHQWVTGLSLYKWPFYSLLISIVSQVTGLTVGDAAYLVNTSLYAVAMLGFIALVQSLGGQGRVLWLAALVVVLHPVLNEFRSFVIRDVGYWACYLWSAAYFLSYVRYGRSSLFATGMVLALLAFLFRIEGILLITVLAVAIYIPRVGNNKRFEAAIVAAVVAGLVVAACAPLWQYIPEADISMESVFQSPLGPLSESWSMVGSDIASRLDALQREFAGVDSTAGALAVYLVTVVALIAMECFKSLGIMYTVLIIYALYRKPCFFPKGIGNWWWLMIGIQALPVFQFGMSNFFLAERYPVALASTLLTVVPFHLDKLWPRHGIRFRSHNWRGLVIGALILIESLEGLDLATNKIYLKEAGLWLRRNAPTNSTVYSNDRIFIYYSGLQEPAPNMAHTWEEAMREVWTGDWRNYDYFVVVMAKHNNQNEVLFLRKIDTKPVKTFGDETGDKVFIFQHG